MQKISAIITDLDDTLWDWVGLWYACYKPFFDKIAEIRQVPLNCVLDSVQRLNNKHKTTEYTFILEELDILSDEKPEEVTIKYSEAIEVFREARRNNFRLYEGVEETLAILKENHCLVVAYTESHEFETKYRLIRSGLERFVDFVYSPADYELPRHVDADAFKKNRVNDYTLKHSVLRHTPSGLRKPNPHVLGQILLDLNVGKEEAVYIGDKLTKDVYMAQETGVLDVWARYGVSHCRELEYGLLKRVTHWTGDEVKAEQETTEKDVIPSIICEKGYSDFLPHITLQSFLGKRQGAKSG